MLLKLSLLSCVVLFVTACKSQGNDSSTSASGAAESSGVSEQCGVVELRGEDFFLKSESGISRAIEPQDGASTNALKGSAESKKLVCIRANWSGKGPVMVVCVSNIRNPAATVGAKEECGTVMMKSSDIVLQVTSNNSENNVDHVLEPQDGASANVLQEMAIRLANACIKADFSKRGQPVLVKSVSDVREVK